MNLVASLFYVALGDDGSLDDPCSSRASGEELEVIVGKQQT